MRSNIFLGMGFLLVCICSWPGWVSGREDACLQAMLTFVDPAAKEAKPEKILPGAPIELKAKVKNVGSQPSASGVIYVRFVFVEPLNTHQKSLLFQTEKVDLPSIQPDEEVEITFKIQHQWPSFFDYIREDWPMRQYEAVVVFDNQEEVIGRTGVSISAHYYQGIMNQLPKQVPSVR